VLTSAACDVLLCSSLGSIVSIVETENNLQIRSISNSSFTLSSRGRTCTRAPFACIDDSFLPLASHAIDEELIVVESKYIEL